MELLEDIPRHLEHFGWQPTLRGRTGERRLSQSLRPEGL